MINLKSSPHPSKNLEVLAEDCHLHIYGLNITVQKGFTWDGTSLPRWAWFTTGTPFSPRFRFAGFLHDVLYRSGMVSRKEADKIFLKLLKSRPDINRYTELKMYAGVRSGGWIAYKKHRKKSKQEQMKYIIVHRSK